MTDAEIVLWRVLRETFPDLHWRHQVPLGAYTIDFCSHRAKLVIEADGGQHAAEASQASEAERTRFLNGEGYRILRFWNHDILGNTDGVLTRIAAALKQASPLVGEVGGRQAASAAQENPSAKEAGAWGAESFGRQTPAAPTPPSPRGGGL